MTTPLSVLRDDARAALLALDLAPAHQRRALDAFDRATDARSLGPLLADLLRLPHDDEPLQAAVDAVSSLRLVLRGVAVVLTRAGAPVVEPTDPPPPSDAMPTPPTGTVVPSVTEPTDPPPPKA